MFICKSREIYAIHKLQVLGGMVHFIILFNWLEQQLQWKSLLVLLVAGVWRRSGVIYPIG